MRMRLTPDCSKMLISTSSGYLLILHDLDLTQSLEVGSYRMLRARRTPLSSGMKNDNRRLLVQSSVLFRAWPCSGFADGGTSASRSAGTPRQGNDSSKTHPPREGQPSAKSTSRLTRAEITAKVSLQAFLPGTAWRCWLQRSLENATEETASLPSSSILKAGPPSSDVPATQTTRRWEHNAWQTHRRKFDVMRISSELVY